MDLGAAVALRGGAVLMAVSLDMTLTGPTPWHVHGKAKFHIFFLSLTITLDQPFGHDAPPPVPAPVDVATLVTAAVADRRNWGTALPRGEPPLVSLRDAERRRGRSCIRCPS